MIIDGRLIDYKGTSANVTVPEGVEIIGDYAFYQKTGIESVILPDSVTLIDERAFQGCEKLIKAPAIPEGVTHMARTFAGCISLIEAPEIPANVTNMTGTFFCCNSLTGKVIIHANPTEYDECFAMYDFEAKKLEFGGSSAMLEELKATGKTN